jgi:YbbR domain-containing protein
MKRLLKGASGLLVHNFWWKLLSVAVAVAIWAVVASEPDLSTFVTARLEFKDLPDDLEISAASAETVSLELRGPSGELRGMVDNRERPEVVLDMSGIRPGQHTYTIGDGNVKLQRGLRLIGAVPSEVRFDFERHLVRSVPVRVRFSGAPPKGYVVESYTPVPATLQIAGPIDHVARVDFVVTDPVDLSGATGSSEFQVNAFVDDPYVRFLTSSQVAVKVVMTKATKK